MSCSALVVANMESSSTTVVDIDGRSVDTVLAWARCFRQLLLKFDKGYLTGSRHCAPLILIVPAVAVSDSVLTTRTDAKISATTPVYPDGVIPETVTVSLAAAGFRVPVNKLIKEIKLYFKCLDLSIVQRTT